MLRSLAIISIASLVGATASASPAAPAYVSATGNPFYLANDTAVLLVEWSFCNEALAPPQFPTHPSPRFADCTAGGGAQQAVSAAANALGPGDAFPLPGFNATSDANAYAVSKELFLGRAAAAAAVVPASSGGGSGAVSGQMPAAMSMFPDFHITVWKDQFAPAALCAAAGAGGREQSAPRTSSLLTA
jgi:hypothetical protein